MKNHRQRGMGGPKNYYGKWLCHRKWNIRYWYICMYKNMCVICRRYTTRKSRCLEGSQAAGASEIQVRHKKQYVLPPNDAGASSLPPDPRAEADRLNPADPRSCYDNRDGR